MRLSHRTAWPLASSPWANKVDDARRRRAIVCDLSVSNPTAVGLVHPPEVFAELARPGVERYEPHPLGRPSARGAVASYYGVRGVAVDPARVWLCAGTSEGYGQLMTLLCDPGDCVLVPAPGYPLLDVLGDLACVHRRAYPLYRDETSAWQIDLHALATAAASPDVRAIVVIAPGNPTGAFVDLAQWHGLLHIATTYGLALVVDEVFADYALEAPPDRIMHVSGELPVPCFVLSGLSKVAALPQLKLSWVVAHGPAAWIEPALARVEHIADATLAVADPIQRALPRMFDAAEKMRERVSSRLSANLLRIRNAVAGRAVDVPIVEGGWTALMRLPDIADDETWATAMLGAGVLVQPGFLFDLPSRGPWIALSLLPERDELDAGLERILRVVDDALGLR